MGWSGVEQEGYNSFASCPFTLPLLPDLSYYMYKNAERPKRANTSGTRTQTFTTHRQRYAQQIPTAAASSQPPIHTQRTLTNLPSHKAALAPRQNEWQTFKHRSPSVAQGPGERRRRGDGGHEVVRSERLLDSPNSIRSDVYLSFRPFAADTAARRHSSRSKIASTKQAHFWFPPFLCVFAQRYE